MKLAYFIQMKDMLLSIILKTNKTNRKNKKEKVSDKTFWNEKGLEQLVKFVQIE